MLEVEEKLVLELLEKVEKGMKSHDKICELFDEAIRMIPRWIPVSERLPDVCGIYLVVVKYKYDFEKEFTYDTDVATFHFGYDNKYIDGQWNTYVDWDEGQQSIHVTHWMPLPKPPE